MARRTLRIRPARVDEPLNSGISESSTELGNNQPPDGASDGATSDDGNNGGEAVSNDSFDPAAAASSDGDGSGDGNASEPAASFFFQRKPRRSYGKRGTRKSKESSQNIEKLLFGCHSMLAALVKCPELEIAEEEAQKLGAAIKEVNDLYDTPTIPPWVLAWGNLAMVCGTVYGPRVLAISKRIADEKVAKAGKITVIPPTPKVATPAPAPVTIEGEHIN